MAIGPRMAASAPMAIRTDYCGGSRCPLAPGIIAQRTNATAYRQCVMERSHEG